MKKILFLIWLIAAIYFVMTQQYLLLAVITVPIIIIGIIKKAVKLVVLVAIIYALLQVIPILIK